MRKANWSEAGLVSATDVLRRACRDVVGGLESLEGRQMLTGVVEWQMNEGPGSIILNDTAPDGVPQTGELIDGPAWVADRNNQAGRAVSLDGVNDRINTSEDFTSLVGSTATVSFWVKTTATGNANPRLTGAVIGAGLGETDDNDMFWGWIDNTGRIAFTIPGTPPAGGRDTVRSTQPINDGSWYHIAMTRDPGTGRIEMYVNGFLNDFALANTEIRDGSPIRNVGMVEQRDGSDSFFNGQLDEFRIDNEVLTQAQIGQMFTSSQPTAATNLAVAQPAGARALRLTWTPGQNVSYYEVWRRVAGQGAFVKLATNATGSSYFDSGLTPQTSYEYYIVAVNPVGQSAQSNTATGTTTAPAAPGNGTGLLGIYYDEDGGPGQGQGGDMTPFNSVGRIATRIDPTINFDWGTGQPHPQIGADTFTVNWFGQVQAQYTEPYTFFKESDDGMIVEIEVNGQWVSVADWDYQGLEGAPGLQLMVVNLVAGQKYNIRVEQFEGGGGAGARLRWTSPSTPIEIIPQSQLFTPPAGAAPAAPSGLTAATGTGPGEITLNWTDNSNNETGFIILRSSSGAAGTFREVARVAGASTFADRTFPGSAYHYQVQAFNTGGTSASSNNANALANGTVRGLLVTYYNAVFDQVGTEPTGAVSGQEVIANPDRNWGDGAPMPGVGPDNFTNVWEGTITVPTTGTYTFVTNTDDGSYIHVGNQLVFNDPTYHGTDRIVGQPVQLTAGPQSFRIRSWDGCCGAAVTVRWIKPDGAEEIIPASAFGNLVVPAPTAPGAAAATNVFSEKVTINWTDSTGESAYFLERASNPTFTDAVQVAQLGSGVTSYTDEEVVPGGTYYYRVRSASLGGHSVWVSTPGPNGQVVTPLDEPVPADPSNLRAALRPNLSAQVTWTDNSLNETNFLLERSTDGTTFTQVASLAPNTTSYMDTNLTAGTTYTYRVRAVNVTNEFSNYSNVEEVAVVANSIVAPWANQDIGTPGVAGGAVYDADEGQYVVVGGGDDIWNASDNFHYLYQPISGDFMVTARVLNVNQTDVWAKAGVMIREELTGPSQHVFNAITPANQAHFQGRIENSGSGSSNWPGVGTNFTGWVRLVRSGQNVTSFWSADGVNWQQNGSVPGTPDTNVATSFTNPLNNDVYVGLAVTSHNNGMSTTGLFDNVSIISLNAAPSQAPTKFDATALPENRIALSWDNPSENVNTSGFRLERSSNGGATWTLVGGDLPANSTNYIDTGTPGETYVYRVRAFNGFGDGPNSTTDTAAVAAGTNTIPGPWQTRLIGDATGTSAQGSVGFLDQTGSDNDVFKVEGGGTDIWGNTDELHYVYQQVTGDFTITTRVINQERTGEWSKAGLDMRESLDGNSRHIGILATGDHDPEFSFRAETGGTTDNRRPFNSANIDAPTWVRLQRTGDTFNAWVSQDGVTFTPVDTNGGMAGVQGYDFDYPDTVYVGLAVSAVNDAELSTVYFDQVNLQTGVTPGITLTGTAGNDNWHLKRNGTQIEVRNNADGSGAPVSTHALGEALTLNGLDGDDTVTVDMSGGDINLSSLTITGANGTDKIRLTNGDGKVLTLASLPTLNGEYLDLGTADLKLTGVALSAVEPLLASARNGTPRWQGPGIGTSSSTADTGLAPVQQGADTLVKYSWNGDANGDGRINADDYFEIDSGFLAPPANPTYADGDFNFDNAINADDYFLIDSAFLGQSGILGSGSATSASSSASASAAVAKESTKAKKAKRASSDSVFGSKKIEKRSAKVRR